MVFAHVVLSFHRPCACVCNVLVLCVCCKRQLWRTRFRPRIQQILRLHKRHAEMVTYRRLWTRAQYNRASKCSHSILHMAAHAVTQHLASLRCLGSCRAVICPMFDLCGL